MTGLYLPSRKATDWRSLLADPAKQWRMGYSARSTALSWVAAANAPPPEIAALLPQDATMLFAAPEWRTPLPGGWRDSQSDVFALFSYAEGLIAATIEAKVDETFGPTLAEWLKDASEGKQERLAAIRALIGEHVRFPPETRYQLLHRTASALIEARRFHAAEAAMFVQSFSNEHRWFEDFEVFAGALGMRANRGSPLIYKFAGGRRLRLGWAVGAPEFRDAPYLGEEDTP